MLFMNQQKKNGQGNIDQNLDEKHALDERINCRTTFISDILLSDQGISPSQKDNKS